LGGFDGKRVRMDTDFQVKVAECVRALNATKDPRARKALLQLRKMWRVIADECAVFSKRQLAEEIDHLSRIHAGLMPPTLH
jgi:hypothetical protein